MPGTGPAACPSLPSLPSSPWGWGAFLAMNPGTLFRKQQVLSSLWSKKSLGLESDSPEFKSHFTTMGQVFSNNHSTFSCLGSPVCKMIIVRVTCPRKV